MSVRIIVGSTADLTPGVRARVDVVPLTIHFGETEYLDGVTIDAATFYEMLVESDVLPTTSQPTPYVFARDFEKAVTEYCPCGTQETTFSFNGINPKSGHNEGKTPKNL